MAFLQIERSDGQVEKFELQTDRIVIGRSPDADVVVTDNRVSRHHAALQQNPQGQWELMDLGSRNKTFVGSQEVSKQVLNNGDVLSIGGVPVHFIDKNMKTAPAGDSASSSQAQAPAVEKFKLRSPMCPECHAPLAPTAVLCVKCGYNRKTGKKLSSLPWSTEKNTTPGRTGTTATSPSNKSDAAAAVCPCCEQALAPGAKICMQCGIDVRTGKVIQTIEDGHLDKAYMYAEGIIRWLSWIIGFGIYPIASEAFGVRKPWVIRGIAVITVLISAWFLAAYIYNPSPDSSLKNWMHWCGSSRAYQREIQNIHDKLKADGYDENTIQAVMASEEVSDVGEYHRYQLITNTFLHGGILHLAGNMLFLMVLGSRVNAMIGNILTLLIYPLLAMASSFIHMAATAHQPLFPAIGASGAIMGLAGMYLVLMPIPNIHMAAWWRWGLIGRFELHMNLFAVRGFWVVLFYIAFDVVYTIFGLKDDIAHWAHLGGFLSGMAVGLILLLFRVINARGGDLLSVLLGRHAWALIGKPNHNAPTFW